MTPDRPLQLLRFALANRDVPLATALARALGARAVRPTPAPRVSAVTDYHPSLASPVGLPAEVTLVADAALPAQEVVYAATGDGGTALKIRTADLLDLTGADVAALVEPGTETAASRLADGSWRAAPVAAAALLRR